jgi:hypothetical protein
MQFTINFRSRHFCNFFFALFILESSLWCVGRGSEGESVEENRAKRRMKISLLQKNGERLEGVKDRGAVLIMEGRLGGNYREIQASFALHFHNGFILMSFFFLSFYLLLCACVKNRWGTLLHS